MDSRSRSDTLKGYIYTNLWVPRASGTFQRTVEIMAVDV